VCCSEHFHGEGRNVRHEQRRKARAALGVRPARAVDESAANAPDIGRHMPGVCGNLPRARDARDEEVLPMKIDEPASTAFSTLASSSAAAGLFAARLVCDQGDDIKGGRLRTCHRRVGAVGVSMRQTASRCAIDEIKPRGAWSAGKVVIGRARRRGEEPSGAVRSCRNCSTRSRWSRCSDPINTGGRTDEHPANPNEHKIPQIINVTRGERSSELATESPKNYVFRIAANRRVSRR